MRSHFLNGRILPKPLLQALLLITMFLLPSTAWGQITVAGHEPDATTGNITGEGITGTVTFDDGTNKLTLKNATINGGIISKSLTIHLEGTNTINGGILLNKDAVSEGTLAFTGAEGSSLTINNNSYCAIYYYNSVDFGELNLATKSSPGVYYDSAEDTKALCTLNYGGGKALVSYLTITTKEVYPLWIAQAGTSDLIQVTEDNKDDILGDSKISFTAPQTLTLSNDASITKGIISGLSGLTIVVDGVSTIKNETDSTTCIRNFAPNATLTIQKSNSETSSLSLTGINFIKDFSNISYGEGIYLSSATDDKNQDLNPALVYYEYNGFHYSDDKEINSLTFSTTKSSESIWIGTTEVRENGTFEGIENVSFDKETNTLTLNEASISADIISSLPNLTINLTADEESEYGQSILSDEYRIISSNPSATLTFTTDGRGSLSSTIGNYGFPWKGFAGNPMFENKLVFTQAAGTEFIKVLTTPTMGYSSGNLTFYGLSDGYTPNLFDCYYSITYEDGNENIQETRYDPGEKESPEPVNMEDKPCTVTAYLSYTDCFGNTTKSDIATGKYFGFAEDQVNIVKDGKAEVPAVVPATDGMGVINLGPVEEGTVSVSGSTVTGLDFGWADVTGTLNFTGSTQNFTILNSADDAAPQISFMVAVTPSAPTISDAMLLGDAISITPAEQLEEDTYTILYSWDENGDGIDYSETPPTAQNGKLYAWISIIEKEVESPYAEKTFSGLKKNLGNAHVVMKTTTAAYTGSAIVPEFTVSETEESETPISSDNYTIGYRKLGGETPIEVESMVDVGEYDITITGTGSTYGGTKMICESFTITQAKNTITTVPVGATGLTYTGEAQALIATEGAATFGDVVYCLTADGTYGAAADIKGTDVTTAETPYTIYYKVVGTTNYAGIEPASIQVSIGKASITPEVNITGWTYGAYDATKNAPSVTETTNPGTGEITYKYKEKDASDETYAIWPTTTEAINAIAAGSYTIQATVAATSNYLGGSATKDFTISAKAITEEMVSLDKISFTYNGDIQYPEITIMVGETSLEENEDYTASYKKGDDAVDGPSDAGDYTLTITGEGNYTGTVTKTITITAKTIATENITVALVETTITYDGTPHTPEVSSVSILSDTAPIVLTTDDYDTENIVYENNINAGESTATATVTLQGNYSGTGVATFTIEQADISEYVVTGLTTTTAYTGTAIVPEFAVKATEISETSLTADDYTTSYQKFENDKMTDVEEMKDAGSYKIIITGKGNYKGSKSIDLTISQATLDLEIEIEGWTYGDKPNEPTLKGNLGKGNVTWSYLYPGEESFVSTAPTAKSPAGDYLVQAVIDETANYQAGSKVTTFIIKQLEMTNSNTTITLDNTELTYNGKEQMVNVTKVMVGDIEVPKECYEVSDNTATVAGNYTAKVTAKTTNADGSPFKNNFKGAATVDWVIKDNTAEISFTESGQNYKTFYSAGEDFLIPDGVTAYIITGVEETTVTVKKVSYLKAGVPILLEKTENSTIEKNPEDNFEGNLLQYASSDVNAANSELFVLYKNEFVKATGTIPAEKCYLELTIAAPAGTRALSIGGDNGTTAIEGIEIETTENDEWHDMQGRRITKPSKAGLYIKNGKKMVVNNK